MNPSLVLKAGLFQFQHRSSFARGYGFMKFSGSPLFESGNATSGPVFLMGKDPLSWHPWTSYKNRLNWENFGLGFPVQLEPRSQKYIDTVLHYPSHALHCAGEILVNILPVISIWQWEYGADGLFCCGPSILGMPYPKMLTWARHRWSSTAVWWWSHSGKCLLCTLSAVNVFVFGFLLILGLVFKACFLFLLVLYMVFYCIYLCANCFGVDSLAAKSDIKVDWIYK